MKIWDMGHTEREREKEKENCSFLSFHQHLGIKIVQFKNNDFHLQLPPPPASLPPLNIQYESNGAPLCKTQLTVRWREG